MIIVNFSHPLSQQQLKQVESLAGQPIEKVIEVHSQIDPQQPLEEQVLRMVDRVPLTPAEWQTEPILINPPSLNFTAVLMVADLHGRMGFFPAFLRLRPVEGAIPPRFEAAEILNLQSIREKARLRREQTNKP
ncbi:MAG: CRISPR-associated protein Csx15 [Chloroflexota bacterium]